MTHMMATMVLVTLCAATAPPAALVPPQHADPRAAHPPAEPTVAGSWTMAVTSPHGVIPMTMVLEQEGRQVTGSLTSGMGERPLKGELSDGGLALRTTDDSANEWTVNARLDAGGGLKGHLSASAGDMPFTAKKDKAPK